MTFKEAQEIISGVSGGMRGFDSIPAEFGDDGGKRSDVRGRGR